MPVEKIPNLGAKITNVIQELNAAREKREAARLASGEPPSGETIKLKLGVAEKFRANLKARRP